MKVTQEQLLVLCHIAQRAGQEVMAVYEAGGTTWQKEDNSPLTQADLRADQVIRQGLETHFPGVFILSEESRSTGSASDEIFFLVDPLDGTKEFLKRNDEFTVNIALVYRARPVAGVVYAPALGEMFYAARDLGAWKKDRQGERAIATTRQGAGASKLRVMGSRSHGGDKLTAWLAQLPCDHAFVGAGSSLKFCRIAEGAADIYPRFGPTSQWDTAAAQCVLELAGGAVTDLQGQTLLYGLDRPILNTEFLAVGDQALTHLVTG